MDDLKTLKAIDSKLSALLVLTVLSLSEEAKSTRIEFLLKKVGLEVADIAKILNKNEGAVRKAIQRAK
ncbi:MAG TPA: sigma factor-like helix-turn-helix DNA-binding protein [Candidatus Paceibacterota bacterium]|nr:sigma factor-like helix-turn-helix DNA-binding protein [Candidatus Paceibacterota bacterium]